jgi:DNA-binding MarR family transcriptional regulator
VLYALLIAGPLPPQDLARFAGVSRASISSALNTLERDGLVTRSRSAADGRSVVVALTDAGHSRTEAAWVEHHRIERALLAEMSRPDRQRLADLLDGVLAAASALVAVQPAAARPSPASPAPAFPAPA